MKKIFLMISFCCSLFAENFLDFEEYAQDFVLETKRIEIPGYPTAFNPSIIRWGKDFLLSFRIIPNRSQSFVSSLGVILLDDTFSPCCYPQFLNLREPGDTVPSRAEDGRLIFVGDKLYLVYSDNTEPMISKGGFRVYIAEVDFDGQNFKLKTPECLNRYEGESRNIREKNWVPFESNGNLLLSYSLIPHLVFRPLLKGTGECETIAYTMGPINWNWGILRGGTSALLGIAPNGDYLSFFHSSKMMASIHSDGKNVLHYFMGAYTFSSKPPFEMTSISPMPIFGKNFYKGEIYKPYWHPVRVVFPGGYIFDDHFLWVAYGRQDHEIWIAKLDRRKLLDSLIPVSSTQVP